MKLALLIKKTAIELDCELETRGNTERAKKLADKLQKLKQRRDKL